MLMARPERDRFRIGLLFALGAAIAFGTSGALARTLMSTGWSPTAAVTARLACGALAMVIFASFVRPGWPREALQHRRMIVIYGLVPIAGAQLCYFNAVSHLSVGVALLVEYTSPILVVGWLWLRGQQPDGRTLAGAALAIAGVTLVLDVFSDAKLNVTGVIWALTAAVCAACYFLLSARAAGGADPDTADDNASAEPLNPITLATGGLLVGAVVVAILGATGIMPLTFATTPVVIAGVSTSWIVPVLALGLISAALAYTLGIWGVALLRPSFGSLAGLVEVLCGVLWAWVLVGETLRPVQVLGGVVVLIGLALASPRDRTPAAQSDHMGNMTA